MEIRYNSFLQILTSYSCKKYFTNYSIIQAKTNYFRIEESLFSLGKIHFERILTNQDLWIVLEFCDAQNIFNYFYII